MSKDTRGLPEYSIKGGICNNPGCMGICVVIDMQKKYWICQKCASDKVSGMFKAIKSIGAV